MELYYAGKNITEYVQIAAALARDVSQGKSDSIDITFENPQAWHKWSPEEDDEIQIVADKYNTGTMYVNTIVPENQKYRILAVSCKTAAQIQKNISYENKKLINIISTCAAEAGMGYNLYGIAGEIEYPYLIREHMGPAAFLNKIAKMEGAVLKTYAGRFTIIDILSAQNLPAIETIEITAQQPGIRYKKAEHKKLKSITIITPYAKVTAIDKSVSIGQNKTICNLPAKDATTAGRWARGLLLNNNRNAEQLTIESTFRPGWTAMTRVDVSGNTAASGQWIIDEVEHDFIKKTSRCVLLRCIDTVG